MPSRFAPVFSTAQAASAQPPEGPAGAELHAALALGLAVLDAHRRDGAMALDVGPALGDIDLPPTSPATLDPALLAPLGPLYLAHELDAAGFLRTAELIAGLFASGAVHQPLGDAGEAIASFWQARRDRLDATERQHLLAQVFDAHAFYPAMHTLCSALVALADNLGPRGRPVHDVRENVGLREGASRLLDLLAAHAGGMVAYAARGILDALKDATRFMRQRPVQSAFGSPDLWGLVATTGAASGISAAQVRERVELGRAGAVVIGWLATSLGQPQVNIRSEQGQTLISSAQRWLLAWSALSALQAQAGRAPEAAQGGVLS